MLNVDSAHMVHELVLSFTQPLVHELPELFLSCTLLTVRSHSNFFRILVLNKIKGDVDVCFCNWEACIAEQYLDQRQYFLLLWITKWVCRVCCLEFIV